MTAKVQADLPDGQILPKVTVSFRDALKAQARNPWGHITSGDMDCGFARCTRAPE